MTAPVYTIPSSSAAAIIPTGTAPGTVSAPSGTASALPTFTGAAYKVGGSIGGVVAMAAAALLL